MTLAEIAERLGCELRGDGAIEIGAIRGLEEAGPGDLTFLVNPKYAAQLAATRASAVIVATGAAELPIATLRADNPYLCFARALAMFHRPLAPPPGIHPTAVVAASARVAAPTSIGPYAVVGEGVEIGSGATIHPHVTIYAGVKIGSDFVAHAGVVVREHVRIGDRVVLHAGVVIGADGFGFAPSPTGAVKIPQAGIVVIEDDVEIGANTTVDRATLGATVIRRGAKLDNLVMVAHNCEVGAHSFLAAQVGIAGSTKIGRGVQMGGQAGAAGHLTIGDGVLVAAQSGVPNSVPAGKTVGGYPAMEVGLWRRTSAAILRLPELVRRVRRLERRLGPERGDEGGDTEG
ncbi:MAG: UDP-3-O-(3-hydroxymyristoyl)glucosamine N-acyltransferase [Deltaproteobacteria bacterium]|nr:UDP-3-O-(3-hydroxymyristoyl)glucosamine N-acyltransferase [Deltaproteobacteria bacterium]